MAEGTHLWCSVTQTPQETQVTLDSSQGVLAFSVDVQECPADYAVLLALTDFLTDHPNLSSPVILHVPTLFLYNLLRDYLPRWQKQHWIRATGQPVAYADILEALYTALSQPGLAYQVVLQRP